MVKSRKYSKYFLIGITLSSIVLLASYWFVLQSQRKQVRHEVRTDIKNSTDKSDLTLLTFHPRDLNSINWKHSSEVKFNGEMYDIIEREFNDGLIYFYCWKDEKESELNKRMDRLITFVLGHGSEHQKHKEIITRLGQTLFCEKSYLIIQEGPSQSSSICIFYQEYLNSPSYTPPTPPPDLG